MQGVRWRPHLLLTHAVPHRVSHFEEKKMLLLYCHDREPLTQDIGRYKRTSGRDKAHESATRAIMLICARS
jgi:hypothetical protein